MGLDTFVRKIITTLIAVTAVAAVAWAIASDPWIIDNHVRIIIVLCIIALVFIVGYFLGVERGERLARDRVRGPTQWQ